MKNTLDRNIMLFVVCMLFLYGLLTITPLTVAGSSAIYVPTDYPTIQEAINAASEGDTIYVDAGTYEESITIDVENLTLTSTGYTEDTVIDAPGAFAISIGASYVTVDGFSVTGTDSGFNLEFNTHTTLTNNNASNNYDCGIQLVFSDDNTLTGNTLSNNSNGIMLLCSNNNILTNNTASNNSLYGITLEGGSGNNTLTGNTVSNNTGDGFRIEDAGNNTFTGNTVENNQRGFGKYNLGGNNIGNEVHYNNIVGNTEYGVFTQIPAETLDVTLSWWGNATGPYHSTKHTGGTGDNVSSNVIFYPWLDTPYPDGNPTFYCINNDTGEVSNSLSEALDQASEGDTINVGVGNIEEDVVITKNVTVIGESEEGVVFDKNLHVCAEAAVLKYFTVLGNIKVYNGTVEIDYVNASNINIQNEAEVTIIQNSTHFLFKGLPNDISGSTEHIYHPAGEGDVDLIQIPTTVTTDAGQNVRIEITEWIVQHKQWIATATSGTVLYHTITELQPTTSYTVSINDRDKYLYTTDANGKLQFDYTGEWSSHIFKVYPTPPFIPYTRRTPTPSLKKVAPQPSIFLLGILVILLSALLFAYVNRKK